MLGLGRWQKLAYVVFLWGCSLLGEKENTEIETQKSRKILQNVCSCEQRRFYANKAKTETRHFNLKRYKTRYTPVKRDRFKNPRHGQHPERDQNKIRTSYLSRPDPCSVDFGPETPKFCFENCRGFLGGFFSPVFSKKKRPEKIHQKIHGKIHPGTRSEKFPSDFCRTLFLII